MTAAEKRGALLFFGKAGCVRCHAVSGRSSVGEANEMFSDFEERVAGAPGIAPFFRVNKGNVIFEGPGQDEDFGLEEITGDSNDRYKFRTAPLRNLAVAPGFFHNGSFIHMEDAIRHHLNVFRSAHTTIQSRLVCLRIWLSESGRSTRFYNDLIRCFNIQFT